MEYIRIDFRGVRVSGGNHRFRGNIFILETLPEPSRKARGHVEYFASIQVTLGDQPRPDLDLSSPILANEIKAGPVNGFESEQGCLESGNVKDLIQD